MIELLRWRSKEIAAVQRSVRHEYPDWGYLDLVIPRPGVTSPRVPIRGLPRARVTKPGVLTLGVLKLGVPSPGYPDWGYSDLV